MTRAGLREATLGGVRWVVLGRGVVETVAFASTIVLARLVPPAAFGLAAAALAVALIAQILAAGGFVTALVQRSTVERRHLAVASAISLGMGALLTAGVWGVAALLKPVVDDTALWLAQLASLTFVLTGASVVPQAILQRRLDFRRLSIVDSGSIAGGTGITLGLAMLGLDGEAIVLGAVATATISTILLLSFTELTAPRWDPQSARELWTTAAPATVASLSYQGFRNVDYVIVAASLGPAQAGFYWRAFQLGVEYQKKITTVMMQMALPVYSRTEGLDHMRALRGRMVRVHAAVVVPILAIFVAIAPVLIPFVYGDTWEPAVVPAQILAGAGMVVALSTGMGPLMTAAGRAKVLAWWNLGLLVGYAATVYVSAKAGDVVTVCIAVTGFYVVQLLIFHYFMLHRFMGLSMRSVVADAAPAGVGSASAVLVAVPLVTLLDRLAVPPPITCLMAAAVGFAVYAVVVRNVFPSSWADVSLLGRRVAPRLPLVRSASPQQES
jgi:O-antigen/teichoic acid export membrane protein